MSTTRLEERPLQAPAGQPATTRADVRCEASIVIPSYNSRQTVRACLASVLAQTTTMRYEIVVADSSDDGTDEIIRSSFPEVRLHHSPRRLSCGAARNAGVGYARAEFVLFVDTDCVVPPDWVERMVAGLREHEADGICGSFENGTPWSLSGTAGYFLEFFRFLGPRGAPRHVRFLLGGNSAYRRSVFENAAFLDCSAGDDFDFSLRLSREGARMVFLPAIAVTHRNRTGIRRVLRYQYALGRAAGRYRRDASPGIMRMLERFPPLVLLFPPAVLVWIGAHVATRCRIGAVARFLAAFPAMLVGNYIWAAGLMHEIIARRRSARESAEGGR